MAKRKPSSRRRVGAAGSGRRSEPRPKKQITEKQYLEMEPDEFAYVVAAYAWRDGMTANKIVKALNWPSDSLHLMRVKRALNRAHGRMLKLEPPADQEWHDKLKESMDQFNQGKDVNIYVVDDRYGPTAGPVFVKAADVVSKIIREAVHRRPRPDAAVRKDEGGNPVPDVTISNAGGRSVSDTVKALLRDPPLLDEEDEQAEKRRERLQFVAGNAAYLPNKFQLSANFLSVTMAEVYGASHLALPAVDDPKTLKEHKKTLNDAAVFVCGAGSKESGLMPSYFKARNFKLPADAVGDLAFSLLDRDGDPVELPEEQGRSYLRQLNPSVDLVTLSTIAANGRVVLILDSEQPESKTQIGAAALRRHYATDVVLGTRLAKSIVAELEGRM